MGDTNDYLVTDEYAALRRIKPQTARKERARRDGPPFYRVGSRCLYLRSEVLAWIETHRVAPSVDGAA
jgi:hypothetical protein